MPFLNLDCFRPISTDGDAEAHINIKIGCCNKKIKKSISKVDSNMLLSLFELSDEKFNEIIRAIYEIRKEEIKQFN